jgi:AcrR family transcriptional regulator
MPPKGQRRAGTNLPEGMAPVGGNPASVGSAPDVEQGAHEPPRRIRFSGPERREQIAAATLSLMARHGLQGTTVARIAEEVGMEAPSLYAHFSNRHEMLLAAMDLLFERVADWLSLSSDPSVLRRLEHIGESHAAFMTSEFDGFVKPTYEFITAPRDSGLSEIVGNRQRQTIDALANLVDEGKQQGTIRQDMDSRLAAYELMICGWAEDVAQLMGIDEFLRANISTSVLRLFLRDMAASPGLRPGLE